MEGKHGGMAAVGADIAAEKLVAQETSPALDGETAAHLRHDNAIALR